MSRTLDQTVLVTPRSFARGDEELRAELDGAVGRVDWQQSGELAAEQLRRLVAGADGWIAGVEPIDRATIAAAPRLRVIARYGVGVDNVDLAAAAEHGVVVTNTPGANAGAVAELVIGLLFALARRIPFADRAVRDGSWSRIDGIALEGKVLGLLGFGAIGREVARRARALGCEVIAYDPFPATELAAELGVELTSRAQVVATSDFLSLHLPVLPETRGLVDAELLAAMKPGAFLVNAARGELVDEDALVAALRSGRLAGAALDALAEEPPRAGFPLGQLDTVVLTPHTGAHTDRAVRTMGRRALANCLAVLRGQGALDAVPLSETTTRSR
ncbi:MAG: serA [Conexibacter sp.]|nr:serA [Conexibacter sp.]